MFWQYRNKLRLEGISRIEEARPKSIPFFFGRADEFVHFADTLKDWRRERKSLADYIEDRAHREAILKDLYRLRDLIALELREELSKPGSEQLQAFIDRRDYFLKETIPYEEGRLLAWEEPDEREDRFDFEQLKGFCILTYQDGAVTKLKLQLEEAGLFSIGWKDAWEMGDKVEPIGHQIRADSSKTEIIKLPTPKRSGTIHIFNHTRKAVELVPAP